MPGQQQIDRAGQSGEKKLPAKNDITDIALNAGWRADADAESTGE